MPGERLEIEPEARAELARALCWRALNRRDRTESELRRMLATKRVDPDTIDRVLTELTGDGYVDDARYAKRFAEDRRLLDGWGSERIEQRLLALGVPREHVAAACAARNPQEELAAAVETLRRRCPSAPVTARDHDRALGILVRRGYALELAYAAVRRHAGAVTAVDEGEAA